MMDWTPYFESICEKYARWWDVYTLTDVEGKIRQQKTAPWFMDLKVQTVERKQEETERQEEEREKQRKEEKIERLTVLDGLKKYAAENHVLLSGRPGSGKSTALARLLLEESVGAQALRPEQGNLSTITQVPILIELRYYQTSIFNLILQFLKRHELIIDRNALENLLMGQATVIPLLLFDGINELPSEDARRDLQRFRESYPKIPMIFTTRDLGIGGDLKIEKKLEMLPLNDSQMREFVRAYLPEKGEQMLRQLGSRLQEFGQTPLLLWMLCSVFESNESQIPANLGLVFRQFTEIYDRKLKADFATYQGSRDWWRQLLQVLAWRMTQGDSKTEIQVAIALREAEAVLRDFLQGKVEYADNCAKQWLKDLLRLHLIQL
jgi:predicted NACHT family NTPase